MLNVRPASPPKLSSSLNCTCVSVPATEATAGAEIVKAPSEPVAIEIFAPPIMYSEPLASVVSDPLIPCDT